MRKMQNEIVEERRQEYQSFREILKGIAFDESAPAEARIAAIREIFSFDDMDRQYTNPYIHRASYGSGRAEKS